MTPRKRTAIITGAAQGIGRKTAEVLTDQGYRLGLMDLRMPEETLAAVGLRDGEAFGYAGSVADEAAVEQFAREAHGKWGAADVLVNNAGISYIAPAERVSANDF